LLIKKFANNASGIANKKVNCNKLSSEIKLKKLIETKLLSNSRELKSTKLKMMPNQ
jgi:hypothetical protein